MDVDHQLPDRQGTHVHIRRIERQELTALLHLDRAIIAAGRGVVLHHDEVSAQSTERTFHRLRRLGEDNAALVGAFVGPILVASAEVHRLDLRSMHHSGTLSMGVHPRWQGRGIGRLLLEAVVAWADGIGLERLELNVLADNDRAVRLYESVGFVLEGTRRGAVRFEGGRVVDDLLMARCRY